MSEPLSRRDFLKVSAVGALLTTGFRPRNPEQQSDAFLIYEGQVNEGESLTSAAERISGKRENSWSTFSMVWNNPQTDCDYHFKNQQSFRYQDIIPLPFAQPNDKLVFGGEKGINEKLNDPDIFTSKNRVTIDSTVKNYEDKIETRLTVFGGRFDRTVFYMLDENRNWIVNVDKNKWVDAKAVKELMLNNPDMKSSEALSQF